jgi:hypothetical protein
LVFPETPPIKLLTTYGGKAFSRLFVGKGINAFGSTFRKSRECPPLLGAEKQSFSRLTIAQEKQGL